MKAGKHRSPLKQQFCTLRWKFPNRAQSFVFLFTNYD